jgi:hypothetical protein
MFLITERSKLISVGPRTSGRVRVTLPNVNGSGCVRAEVSKKRLSRSTVEPESFALRPVLFGREPAGYLGRGTGEADSRRKDVIHYVGLGDSIEVGFDNNHVASFQISS